MENINTLSTNARKLVELSTNWLDPFWDPGSGLLWAPSLSKNPKLPLRHHMVRDTIWYVLGLFLRRNGSDVFRGLQSIQAILDHQFNQPGKPFHGTFRRSPEEIDPPEQAVEWNDYDPNWREFICTALDLLLIEFPTLVPKYIEQRIYLALRLAVEGSLARGLRPNYTNIALMHAYLLCQAGLRLNEPDWVTKGEEFATDIYTLFSANKTFYEYNSPTYYGVDLFALGLWRKYKPTPLLAKLGREMETQLWEDISRYYHPLLRNMCGPYDRAYDMDMRNAVAVLGEWIFLITGQKTAPFPDETSYFAHSSDISFAPCVAIIGIDLPDHIKNRLISFSGEHSFSQVITSNPRRVASAWLTENFMVGAESTSLQKNGYAQFHPLTIHWMLPNGNIGWIRARHLMPIDAIVSPRKISILFNDYIEFEVFLNAFTPLHTSSNYWEFPQLKLSISTQSDSVVYSAKDNFLEKTFSLVYKSTTNTPQSLIINIE